MSEQAEMFLQHLAEAQDRYRFIFPELYVDMQRLGCFDPFAESYLQLSDLLWLPMGHITAHQFHKQQIDGLVPFGRTANEDLWCFYPGIDAETQQAVVFCPDEDEVATIYAPDFRSFVYRSLLEEFACTGLTEHYDVKQSDTVLRGYVDVVAGFLPAPWIERLRGLAALPWEQDRNGYYGAISESDLEAILEADLPYQRLDEEFEHFIDD